MSGELIREKPACTPPPVARTQLSCDAWVGRAVRTLLSLDRPAWERGRAGAGACGGRALSREQLIQLVQGMPGVINGKTGPQILPTPCVGCPPLRWVGL